MKVQTTYPHAEKILMSYQEVIKKDYQGYRNHVIRMLNFCHYLLPDITIEQSRKLQIAAAFHDIALWTHDRVDYLVPSYQECAQYLAEQGLSDWAEEITVIIDMHHLLSQYQGPHQQLTEIFRQADLVDFSLGMVKHGIDKQFIKAVKQALPNQGFHRCLARFTLKQLTRNPFKPMPMIRVKNIYK